MMYIFFSYSYPEKVFKNSVCAVIMSVLEVSSLSVSFLSGGRLLPAVSDLSFTVEKGEILALVGESGCGKSVSCMSLARLLPEPPAKYLSGSIKLEGINGNSDVLKMSTHDLRKIRGSKIAYIFQEPSVSLNPVFTVGYQISEVIDLHRPEVQDVEAEIISLLKQVGIPAPEKRINAYPHEMSGGMLQRIMIAMALAGKPEILIADEPTTALDVTIQAQILELLAEIREKSGMAVILVTHNLGIVSELADRVIVMYAGRAVETAKASELMKNPLHPYTRALLSAVPELGKDSGALTSIPGTVPSPAEYPQGCRFSSRCALRNSRPEEDQDRCMNVLPPFGERNSGHFCACHYS